MENNNSSSTEDLDNLLESVRVKITDTYNEAPQILYIGDSVTGTLGNFSASTGKAKSKKTFNVSALVASALTNTTVLRYRASLSNDKRKILYIDTEQSRHHCKLVLDRILRLANFPLNSEPENLTFYALRKFPPDKRIQLIEKRIYQTENLGLVIIDGIRDLVHDINSSNESTNLISLFMKWTDELQIHIHTVLHQNKSDDNSRGHLGTELNNKAETIFQVVKDNNDRDTSFVSPVYMRDKDFEVFAFHINDNSLPELIDDYEHIKSVSNRKTDFRELSESQHQQALTKTFEKEEGLNYSMLIENLKNGYQSIGFSFGRNKTVDLNKFLINKRMILKEGKLYKYNPNFHY